VLAAAAPSRFVTAIHSAARDAGCEVAAMAPAEGAWAAAAVAMWPTFARGTAHLLVHEDDRIVLVELQRGQVGNVRRFRGGAADAVLIATTISEGQGGAAGPVGAFGHPAGRQELVRALGTRGVSVNAVPAEWLDYAESAEVMAALYAGVSTGPMLASESVRAATRERVGRATMMVAGVAALLMVLAAGFELWGVHRELAAVQAEREAIRPQVSATLIGRSSLEDAYKRLSTIAEGQRRAPRWAPVLADLTRRLPEDAYLTTVRTSGDSLLVDGMAASAAKVFAAVDSSTMIKNVRAAAPVRRQSQEGADPMERFTLAALLPGAVTAPPAPSKAGGKAP
jgi:Tfp pilus assembly protein PilN